jgi:hypothetical protein
MFSFEKVDEIADMALQSQIWWNLITIGFKNDRFGHSLSYYTGQFPSERRKLHQLPYPEPRERYYLCFFFHQTTPPGLPDTKPFWK